MKIRKFIPKKILEDNIKLREEVNRNGEIISVLLGELEKILFFNI
jgi:hypothetical protein